MNIQNPLLKQIEQQNEAKVQPELKATYQRIVTAGEHILYSPQAHKLMQQQMKSNKDPALAAGEGIAKLLAILINQSKKTLNMNLN